MDYISVAVQPTVNLPSDLEAALANRKALIDAGFSILPLIDTAKHPACRWERFQTERATLEQAVGWMCDEGLFTNFKRRPDLVVSSMVNTGIATGAVSGIVVLDLDNEDAIRVAERLGLPHTVTVATPRGRHIYFRHPGGVVPNRADIFADRRKKRPYAVGGFDIRGDGGFVVAPGSIFVPSAEEAAAGKRGGTYRWVNSPADAPLAEMPAWLIATLAYRHQDTVTLPPVPQGYKADDRRYQSRAEKWAAAIVENRCSDIVTAPNGTQNDTIFKAAAKLGGLVAGGLVEEGEAFDRLVTACHMGNHPRSAARTTIKSGLSAGKRSPIYGPPDDPAVTAPKKMSLAQALKLAKKVRA